MAFMLQSALGVLCLTLPVTVYTAAGGNLPGDEIVLVSIATLSAVAALYEPYLLPLALLLSTHGLRGLVPGLVSPPAASDDAEGELAPPAFEFDPKAVFVHQRSDARLEARMKAVPEEYDRLLRAAQGEATHGTLAALHGPNACALALAPPSQTRQAVGRGYEC